MPDSYSGAAGSPSRRGGPIHRAPRSSRHHRSSRSRRHHIRHSSSPPRSRSRCTLGHSTPRSLRSKALPQPLLAVLLEEEGQLGAWPVALAIAGVLALVLLEQAAVPLEHAWAAVLAQVSAPILAFFYVAIAATFFASFCPFVFI